MTLPKLPQFQEHSPLLYKINYMVYMAVFGMFIMYYYVTSYGGQMPESGSFVQFIKDTWKMMFGLGIWPIILATLTHYIGKKKQNRRVGDR